MTHTILRTKDVIAKTAISRTNLHNQVKAGTFPAPIPLGGHLVGWIEKEVDDWIDSRVQLRDGSNDGESDGENKVTKQRKAA